MSYLDPVSSVDSEEGRVTRVADSAGYTVTGRKLHLERKNGRLQRQAERGF